MSILCVLVTIAAWLSIFNHCALGAAVPEKPKVEQGGCPFHAKKVDSGKEKPKTNESPCCKVLRAVSATSVKNVARSVIDLGSRDFQFAEFAFSVPPRIFLPTATLDTGPPGKTSFIELIPSSPWRAPPFLA